MHPAWPENIEHIGKMTETSFPHAALRLHRQTDPRFIPEHFGLLLITRAEQEEEPSQPHQLGSLVILHDLWEAQNGDSPLCRVFRYHMKQMSALR